MLFNSIDFALFLPVVFCLYWFVFNKNLKIQNAFILLASYVFYGWWDYRFLFLVFASSLCDYLIGQAIHDTDSSRKKKWLLYTSLFINLGMLGFFKYYNFFIDSFLDAFSLFGVKPDIHTLNIILPVGISFYTFQTLSYTIDIYRGNLKPARDAISFFAFVSFFPQLVAGPIERAKNLLPQFYKERVFDYDKAIVGVKLIIWGLFQKIVLADTCGTYVNEVFGASATAGSNEIMLACIFFIIQVYCDFSGYSYVAIGAANLFGFKLMINFRYPFLSRNLPELWRRWHISLMGWFRDYLYSEIRKDRRDLGIRMWAIFVVFAVSGLWHGANWTYVLFGIEHGLIIVIYMYFGLDTKYGRGVVAQGRKWPTLAEIGAIVFTFLLSSTSSLFFRAENVAQSMQMIKGIFTRPFVPLKAYYLEGAILFAIMMLIEWLYREQNHPFEKMALKPVPQYAVFYGLLLGIILYASNAGTQFIYFQF